MRLYLKFLAIFLFWNSATMAQEPDYKALDIYERLNSLRVQVDNDDKVLVTNRGLNYFLAKQLSYYISGTRDMAMYDFSTAVDVVDGRFGFNYNRGFFRSGFNDSKLKAMLSVGFETDALQGIGKIWSSDKKFNDDIGFNLKLSVPIFSNVKFDMGNQVQMLLKDGNTKTNSAHQSAMELYRDDILQTIKDDIEDEKKKYSKWDQRTKASAAEKQKRLNKFIGKTNKSYAERFFKEEAEALEEGESETYTSSKMIWGSVYGYIPVNTKRYDYINTITDTAILENKVYRFYMNGEMNFMFQHNVWGSMVLRVGYEGRMTNEIIAEKVEKADIGLYRQLQQSGDSMLLARIEKKEPYLGAVNNRFTHAMNLQVTIFPFQSKNKWFGLNVLFHPVFNGKEAVKYASTLSLGLPISIAADKEGEKRVNIEPQLVFDDVLNESSDKPTGKKLSLGLKVGLPLGGMIHKAKD